MTKLLQLGNIGNILICIQWRESCIYYSYSIFEGGGRMLKYISRLLLSISFTIWAGVASAGLIDFDFSFTNLAGGGGTVTGVLRNLSEGTGSASSVEVLSNTDGFGLGEYVGNPLDNRWTVIGGELVGGLFQSLGALNTTPDVTDSSLFIAYVGSTSRVGLSPDPGIQLIETVDNVTFTRRVPVPATLALFGLGLAGLGWSRRKKA